MFPRIAPLFRMAPRAQQIRRMGGHGVPAHWKPLRQLFLENKNHMDCMPVPGGSWQEAYNKQNAKWNQLLALSILSVIVTAGVLYQSGAVYFHSAPPLVNKKE